MPICRSVLLKPRGISSGWVRDVVMSSACCVFAWWSGKLGCAARAGSVGCGRRRVSNLTNIHLGRKAPPRHAGPTNTVLPLCGIAFMNGWSSRFWLCTTHAAEGCNCRLAIDGRQSVTGVDAAIKPLITASAGSPKYTCPSEAEQARASSTAIFFAMSGSCVSEGEARSIKPVHHRGCVRQAGDSDLRVGQGWFRCQSALRAQYPDQSWRT